MHHQGSKTGRQMEGPRAGKSPCSTFVQIRKTWSSLVTPRVKDPAWSLQPGLLLWQAQKLLHAMGAAQKNKNKKPSLCAPKFASTWFHKGSMSWVSVTPARVPSAGDSAHSLQPSQERMQAPDCEPLRYFMKLGPAMGCKMHPDLRDVKMLFFFFKKKCISELLEESRPQGSRPTRTPSGS